MISNIAVKIKIKKNLDININSYILSRQYVYNKYEYIVESRPPALQCIHIFNLTKDECIYITLSNREIVFIIQ